MPTLRWTYEPRVRVPPSVALSAAPAAAPVQIHSNGLVVRSLMPGDVTDAFVTWINAPAMSAGLNLPKLDFDAQRLRLFVSSFDNRRSYMLGIFEGELLIGFYTIDVNTNHKVATITAGISDAAVERRRVYWSTIDAVLDHFFIYRDIDKIVARVLAHNRAMLFNFVDNSRFVHEASLRQECLGPSGERLDVLVFAAFRQGPRPDGRGLQQ